MAIHELNNNPTLAGQVRLIENESMARRMVRPSKCLC